MPQSTPHSAILHDLPADVDQLGFKPYANALADIILDPNTNTPLTLGLFGTWGSGKSSLMRQMQKRVRDHAPAEGSRSRTVWFNAWKYNQEETLWRALLLVLLDDLEQLLNDQSAATDEKQGQSGRSPRALLEALREALYHDTSWNEQGKRTVNWSDLVTGSLGLATSILLSGPWQPVISSLFDTGTVTEAKKEAGKGKHATDMGKVIGAFKREEIIHYQAQLRSLEQFQATFSELVGFLLPANGNAARLVVFIDDLDRCVPEKAITVLEALKLFLDVEGCVFVLALDSEAIESAIRRRYQGEVKAREYLDKIVQVQFRLPPIQAEQMRAYVQSLAPQLPDPRCNEVFAVALGANPRQVKRAINVFLLLSRIIEHRQELGKVIQPVRLAKIVAIQHVHPELYMVLRDVPGYLSDLNVYYGKTRQGVRSTAEPAEPATLPEALQPFSASPALAQIFAVADNAETTFVDEKPEALRPYFTLTQQAVMAELQAQRSTGRTLEPHMIDVPAGPFLMGTSPKEIAALARRYAWAKEEQKEGWLKQESPQHWVEVADFAIGHYPVLNVEYAEFVRASGHAAPRYWQGNTPPSDISDHPVVNVTWHDALAYVQWLAETTGKPYRLPTEAEWEKAAGWDAATEQKRTWPWGDAWDAARANCRPDGPGRTTARGQYSPAGDSPSGCADMAGNVWEWCSSLYRPYPYVADDGREDLTEREIRVLRGGSWYNNNPAHVRCAFRYRLDPDYRYGYYGFRVARSSLR